MYQGRKLKVLNTLPALIAMAMLAVCTIASAATTLVFSYPKALRVRGVQYELPGMRFTGSVISDRKCSSWPHEAGAAWYTTEQNIQSFTTDFTFQMTPSGSIPCYSRYHLLRRE